MKKTKSVEVTVCDLCSKETETRQCAGCSKDACSECSLEYTARSDHWYPESSGMKIFTTPIFSAGPTHLATYCNECSPDQYLLDGGFTSLRLVHTGTDG